jgi:hypothetical protein
MTIESRDWKRRTNLAAAVTLGLLLMLACYAFLALGECLPRDASAQMQACDKARSFEFWAYPSLCLSLFMAAALLGRKGLGRAVAPFLAAPFLAFALMAVMEWVLF